MFKFKVIYYDGFFNKLLSCFVFANDKSEAKIKASKFYRVNLQDVKLASQC